MDYLNPLAMATALQADRFPQLRLLSCHAYLLVGEENAVKASAELVEQICRHQRIRYHTPDANYFEYWLASELRSWRKR